ncbi:hypothetical protein DdX_16442 [Ditylenchus destructor]|uniref:Uncharacterized protein n=1 Tax=Ditylenchus destructor TaxID=166010 RepID=A0AAD4MNU3_9BILA|nr:hypothetical protein DdX_16442 [Ditylenchus destructor]
MFSKQYILISLLLLTFLPIPTGTRPCCGGPTCYAACQSAASVICTATIIYFTPCYAAAQAACSIVLAGPATLPECEELAVTGCEAFGPFQPVCFVLAQGACACLAF